MLSVGEETDVPGKPRGGGENGRESVSTDGNAIGREAGSKDCVPSPRPPSSSLEGAPLCDLEEKKQELCF